MNVKYPALFCVASALTALLLSGCGGGGGGSQSSPQPTTLSGALQSGDKTFGVGGSYVVFYHGTAQADGTATVTLHGSTFAPLLMVGLKDSSGNIHTISTATGLADNASGPTGASESFTVTKGTVYFFAATDDPTANPQTLATGSFTITFSDILQSVQQDNTINASTRGASLRSGSGGWAEAKPTSLSGSTR